MFEVQRLNKKKVKKLFQDILLNFIGMGLPLIVLNLIIYPMVAQKISEDLYGQMQSLISVTYLVGGTLGGVLCTTRLIQEYKYKKYGVTGDFILLYWVLFLLAGIVSVIILCIYLQKINLRVMILVTGISIATYMIEYLLVAFRLELNFKNILYNNIFAVMGYFCGFLLFIRTLEWEYIFLGAMAFQIIYLLKKTSLLHEPKVRTVYFHDTVKIFRDLSISVVLDKALLYFDKLLIYPLLGGKCVAIYFTANIFGKMILQIMTPIANVILSYLSQKETVGKNAWKLAIYMGIPFCIFMYVIVLFVADPILNIFYPQWTAAAIKLIPITTVSLCLSSFINIIYPLSLKTLATNRQILINSVSLVVYVVSVLCLFSRYRLLGCCIALMLAYGVKLIVILIFCYGKKYEKHKN